MNLQTNRFRIQTLLDQSKENDHLKLFTPIKLFQKFSLLDLEYFSRTFREVDRHKVVHTAKLEENAKWFYCFIFKILWLGFVFSFLLSIHYAALFFCNYIFIQLCTSIN